MFDGLFRLVSWRDPLSMVRDGVDVLLVAFVIYRALLVVRGTRAMQMAAGLAIVFLVYLGSKVFGLVTLHNLLSWLLSSVVLLVVVIFQNDIRRALIRMGGRAFFSSARDRETRVIDEVVAAATELARHRMGALIAFEQDANILEFTKSEGIALDAAVTRELLVNLFVPESVNKLHDGAVLIRDLKVARAGVFFPMPDTKILDHALGSRHRAALGITEETDAVVVVVSEERGTISFCFSGNIVQNLDAESLRSALLGLLGRAGRKPKPGAKQAKVDSLASVVTPRSVPPTSRPPAPAAEPKSEGRPPASKVLPGTIRAPEPRPADSDRPPPSTAELRPRDSELRPRDSVPPSATSTPIPMSESVVHRGETRPMPPARSTFLAATASEPEDVTPAGDDR
ncbi:MAG: diadenylate cyclase CdaA [Polyangiaceae bacterium]